MPKDNDPLKEPERRARLIGALEVGSNDIAASNETRRNAERLLRNLRAFSRDQQPRSDNAD